MACTCSTNARSSWERYSCPAILPSRYLQWWKWIVTVSLAIVYFVSWGNIHSYPLLFGPLQEEFQTSAIETGWVGSVNIGMNCLASPLAAFLERRIGFRATIVLGVLFCATGVFVSSFAPQLFMLYFTYGTMYGIGINLSFHASLCLMVQYFPNKNCRRATSVIMIGGTSGMLVFSPVMERLIEMFTWRGALRISGIFVLFLGLPFALLCKSPEETVKEVEKVVRKYSKCADSIEDTVNKCKRDLQKVYPGYDPDDKRAWKSDSSGNDDEDEYGDERGPLRDSKTSDLKSPDSKCEKEHAIDLLENVIVHEKEEKSGCRKWRIILGSWRTWIFIISVFISTFSWSFYWVNLVSHLSNVGLSQRQSALVLSSCAAAELITKVLLALFGDRLPVSNVSILGIQGLITSAFTVGVMFINSFGAGIGVILGVGCMRGIYQVVPYMSCVEIIGTRWGDEAQTLTLVVQGFGYLVGALPSGAIYDLTQSYQTCLVMVFILFIVSSVALFIIQIYDRFCARRQEKELSAAKDMRLKHLSLQNEIIGDKVTTV
ncbi:monocarboxylate transporter 9-like isoform X1 [Lytechinus variegatus]|uniref:monocarboxylate transporter 9-like isoform X1 n=1 Tax=Lytechinus variegatus TaxID=7654 RepID=UPI001BB1E582|nr:monocarboxylate transporter 9-like isoform X1 [Lytechinus variegatus]